MSVLDLRGKGSENRKGDFRKGKDFRFKEEKFEEKFKNI